MTEQLKKLALRVTSAFLVLVFILSAFVAGTYAWGNYANHKTNDASGMPIVSQVILQKLEKALDGTVTGLLVPGAEFYLYKVEQPRDIQIGGRYVTDQNGQIRVQGLKSGKYYFLETRPGYNYAFDQDEHGNPVTRYDFEITGLEEDNRLAVTAYNRRMEGPLTVTKIVRNSDGSLITDEQSELEFAFTVTFSDGGTYTYRVGNGGPQEIESGGTIRLKHGQTAIFENLPIGVQYKIEEAGVPRYTVESTGHQGQITENGSHAVFTNTYNKEAGKLVVTKSVIGPGADKNKEFEFTAVIGGVTYTFTLKHGQSQIFDDLPPGTHYTVTEGDYTMDGYISSPNSYTGDIINGTVTLPFTNVYDQSGDPGSLKVSKHVVSDKGVDTSKEFTFDVAFKNLPDEPVTILVNGEEKELSASNSTFKIKLKHDESVLFENIPAGVAYSVVETPFPDYIASIIRAEGTIASNFTVHVSFVNDQSENQRPSLRTRLIVQKQVDGEVSESDKNRKFKFVLEVEGMEPKTFELRAGESIVLKNLPVGAKYTVYEADIPDGYVLTGVTNGSGSLSVDSITAKFTNKFVGTVKIPIEGEKTWDLQGNSVKLPESVTIYLKKGNTVVDKAIVKPDKDGKWTYTFDAPKYEPDGVTEIKYHIEEAPVEQFYPTYNGMDVKNTYIAPVITDGVKVRKSIDGKNAPDTTFEFIMTAQKNAPMPEGAAGGRNTITITGAGTAGFGQITYTKPGVYVYTITEQNTGADGWTYDPAVYTYTVKVEEKNGVLSVKSRTLVKDGIAADIAAFINRYTYTVPSEKIEISGSKTWNHGDNKIKNYPESILVYVKVGDVIVAQRTVTASDHWTYIFRLPKYDGSGKEIVYTIDEEKVPGYQKKVEGYNLLNTYDPNDPDNPFVKPGGPDDPGNSGGADGFLTGDGTNVWLWIALMLLSLAGLFATRLFRPKQERIQHRRKL